MKDYLKPEIAFLSFETEAIAVVSGSFGIEEDPDQNQDIILP